MSKKEPLNPQETSTHKKVFSEYCLLRSDFGSEHEYNIYLEERENVVFSLISKNETDRAEAALKKFQKEHKDMIDQRKSESLAQHEITHTWKVLPLQSQMESERQKKKSVLFQSKQISIEYNDEKFSNDANKRAATWVRGATISLAEVGGASDSWLLSKSRDEFMQALTRPNL